MLCSDDYLSLASFARYPLMRKVSEVFRYGFLLTELVEEEKYLQLYSYSNFYVEVEFGVNPDEIQNISALSIEDTLDLYLSKAEWLQLVNQLLTD